MHCKSIKFIHGLVTSIILFNILFLPPETLSANNNKIPNIAGSWHGKLHADGVDFDTTLEISQNAASLDGCLTNVDSDGTSKHYVQGSFESSNEQFVFKDVGIDKISGDMSSYPDPIDRYEIHLVNNGNKLIGSCQQQNKQKQLWISLDKQVSDNSSQNNLERPSKPISHNATKKSIVHQQYKPFTVPTRSNQTADSSDSSTSSDALTQPNKFVVSINYDDKSDDNTKSFDSYMAYLERVVKHHWHPPQDVPGRKMIIFFRIDKSGNISDLQIDPSQPTIMDDFTESAFDAIKAAAPFNSPPMLAASKSNFMDIHFSFHEDQNYGNTSTSSSFNNHSYY